MSTRRDFLGFTAGAVAARSPTYNWHGRIMALSSK